LIGGGHVSSYRGRRPVPASRLREGGMRGSAGASSAKAGADESLEKAPHSASSAVVAAADRSALEPAGERMEPDTSTSVESTAPGNAPPSFGARSSPVGAVTGSDGAPLYSLSVTVGKEFAEKLEEVRAYLSHSIPDGDLARVLELGLDTLLINLRRRRCAERTQDRRTTDAQEQPPGAKAQTSTQGAIVGPGSQGSVPLAATGSGSSSKVPLTATGSGSSSSPDLAADETDPHSHTEPESSSSSSTQAAGDHPDPKSGVEGPPGLSRSSDPRPIPAESSCQPMDSPRRESGCTKSRSRYISAEVRRQVWARDEGCCTYTNAQGQQCRSTWFLQIDHIRPYAVGGGNHLSNLRLLCGVHNRQRGRVP
jgi:hypothetical protein